MFFIGWSPRLPIANLGTSARTQLTRYLFSISKLQVLLPAVTNPVLQANTKNVSKERHHQESYENSLLTLVCSNKEKKRRKK